MKVTNINNKVTIIVPGDVYEKSVNSNDWYEEKLRKEYYDLYCCEKLKSGRIYIYNPKITREGIEHSYYKVKNSSMNIYKIIKILNLDVKPLFKNKSLIHGYNYYVWKQDLLEYDKVKKLLDYKSYMFPKKVVNKNLFSKGEKEYEIISFTEFKKDFIIE